MVKKGLVYGIILLFSGTSIVPNISSKTEKPLEEGLIGY